MFMRSSRLLLSLVVFGAGAGGCNLLSDDDSNGPPDISEPPDSDNPPPPGDQELPAPIHPEIAARLPVDWSGTGTLEAAKETVAGAPEWSQAAAALVDVEGERFLRTTGISKGVRNISLARSHAEARARAGLASWTGEQRLVGSTIIDSWMDPGTHVAISLAQLRVPANWQPGQPLVPEQAEAVAQPDPPATP